MLSHIFSLKLSKQLIVVTYYGNRNIMHFQSTIGSHRLPAKYLLQPEGKSLWSCGKLKLHTSFGWGLSIDAAAHIDGLGMAQVCWDIYRDCMKLSMEVKLTASGAVRQYLCAFHDLSGLQICLTCSQRTA